jgi:hypothetical protein
MINRIRRSQSNGIDVHNQPERADGIVPTDIAKGIHTKIPADFNPLPKTNPSA